MVDMPVLQAKLGEVTQLIPREDTAEQIADSPAPQVLEPTVEGGKDTPKERVQQRTGEPTIEVPASQIQEATAEVTQLSLPQRQGPTVQAVQERLEAPHVPFLHRVVGVPVATQTQVTYLSAPVPVPQTMEDIREVIRLMPQVQPPDGIVEETIDIPIPQLTEETIDAVKHVPQERVPHHTLQQSVDVPDPQIQVETDEVTQLMPQERTAYRVVEEIINIPSAQTQERVVDAVVDVTVPQLREEMGEVTQLSPHAYIAGLEKIIDAPRSGRRSTKSCRSSPNSSA